jgi:hypothetical protein
MDRLKRALAKASKRLAARIAEANLVGKKTRRLNKEIKALRAELDALVLDGANSALIKAKLQKLEFKVGRRSSLKTRRIKARKRTAWWLRRKTTVAKKLKTAEEKWAAEHRLDFEPWMLNGCPETHNENLKEVIAYVVVVCGQYITATSNGTHTPGSYHYRDEAADWGAGSVSSMQAAAVKTREHFGRGHFLEFFSPCPWWIKYGTEYAGYFPGHGDHGHTAVGA